MYILFSLIVGIAVVVVDFQLLTNFKASVLMVCGTLLAFAINYGMSEHAIHETAPKYLRGLMRKWIWYKDELSYVKIQLITALICIGVILFGWYVPRDYSMNWIGVGGSLLVLMTSSFFANLFGTLRGMQDVSAKG